MYGTTSVATIKIITQGATEHEKNKIAIAQAQSETGGCIRTFLSRRQAIVCQDPKVSWRTFPSYNLPSGTVDYDSVFRVATRCTQRLEESETFTASIPLSNYSCRIDSTFSGDVVRHENIEGNRIALAGSSSFPLILASPGRIRISERLASNSDLVVVAGGDVRIRQLENTGTKEIRVSIFSSLGSVVVESLGDRISLLSAGRQSIQVPPSQPSSEYPLPPFKLYGLRGFEIHN